MHTTHSSSATPLRLSILVAGVFALSSAFAANTDKAMYKAAKDQAGATYKADKAACDKLAGNTKDICVQEAKAKEKLAKAEAEYAHTGKDSDRTKVAYAKADGTYDVAKERCDDKGGNEKDVCVKEAKAEHVKAKADAKVAKEGTAARKDAATDKNDADYKVATEKCDALSGDAKSSCVAAAKAKHGKS